MDNGRPLRDEHGGRGFDHRHKTIFLKVENLFVPRSGLTV